MKKEYWWLVLIIIIAAYLRVANIESVPPGLYPDEAMNGNNALEALDTHDFKVFYPENNGREGLFINIQAIFISFLGNEPWVLRLPSVIFGILTVLGIYFLTKEFFCENPKSKILNPKQIQSSKRFGNWKLEIGNCEVALLSSFLIATSFWHIDFSRIGFRAIMAPFFLTWGIYFLLLSFRQAQESKPPKSYILNSIFGGIFYGLGFYSYIAYRATPLIILCILAVFFIKARKERWSKHFCTAALTFIAFTILVTLPLNIYFLNNPQDFLGRTSQISIFNSATPVKDLHINITKTAGMFNIVGDWNWRHNIAGHPLLSIPVGIIFLVGLISGLRSLSPSRKGDKLRMTILFLWTMTAAAPVVISNEGLPHALRAILMAPPIMIFSAFGGLKLYEYLQKRITIKKLNIIALILLATITIESYVNYFIVWAKNPNTAGAFNQDYAEIGRELNALPKETPKFVIINAPGVDVRGIPMPAQTVMFITNTFRNEERINKNIRYLTPAELPETIFPENAFIRYLN